MTQTTPFSSPIIRSVPSDHLSLHDLALKLQASFLFEGSPGGWFDGTVSLLGAAFFATFQSEGEQSSFDHQKEDGTWTRHQYNTPDPLSILQSWLNRFRPTSNQNDLSFPFLGGAVGFFSYDFNQRLEKTLLDAHSIRGGRSPCPDIHLLFVNAFVLYDHTKPLIHIVYDPAPLIALGWDPKSAYDHSLQEIAFIEEKMKSPNNPDIHDLEATAFQYDESGTAYRMMVSRAKEYIAAGDIFQANLSHRFHATISGKTLFPLYQTLQKINPSPFSAYLNMGGIEIASGSPERLVRVKKTGEKFLVETRPIAGTCERGSNDTEDQEKIAKLYGSNKERAEHLMLVDLERNDLGKVSKFGSVSVDTLMTLERYSHVFHLVSNITGELKESVSSTDVIRALFPGGTITGVPKVRCMQIIAELEKVSRGPYTGALGYLGFNGEMDFNIIIRSFYRKGNDLFFQVGAGIVADSDPDREYQETLHKAAALIKAFDGTFTICRGTHVGLSQ
ncbi:MAG: anthranilate synthase component I family protein [Nitrospirota bacterium]